jgi:CRP-like cAMP-binding protein
VQALRTLAAAVSSESQKDLLSALADAAERAPERFVRSTVLPGAAPLIVAGQPVRTVYVILTGRAEVLLIDGRVLPVGPGSPLGEIAALSSTGVATATVRVTEPCELVGLSRDDFRELREAAAPLVAERLAQSFARSLPPAARETLRAVRDQNTDALILRTALRLVHGAGGIYARLNPEEATQGTAPAEWGVIRQKSSLIAAVASMLKSSRTEADVARTVDEILALGLSGMPALRMFKGEAALAREEWTEQVQAIYKPHLRHALSADEFLTVCARFERLHWLDGRLMAEGVITESCLPGTDAESQVMNFLAAREDAPAVEVFSAIDDVFERVMDAGLHRGSARTLDELTSVRFQKVRADLSAAGGAGQSSPDDHPNYTALGELRRRLARGEQSAIGGVDYALQRFPRVLLDRIVDGEIPVIAFDGPQDAGIAYGIEQLADAARQYGVRPECMTTEVQGLDGSGGRTLITARESGRQVLVLAGHGESRQRHNAGSIVMYQRSGRRVPEANLRLASAGVPYIDRIRADIQRALAGETLPTQLLILQNPKEFAAGFMGAGGQSAELRAVSGLFDMWIGYAHTPDGIRRRFILPKVGGRGLYGDTAGLFVEACFTAGIAALSRHIVFNGTAGGFLERVKPGERLMCPIETFGQHVPGAPARRIAAETCFGAFASGRPVEARAAELFDRLGGDVCFTSHHVAVGAPADETYDLIRELVAAGYESIDVEGGAIMAAVERLNASRPAGERITFIALYTFSDNPLRSEHDRYDSLAIMGPFFEGARFHAPLWDVLRQVVAFAG